jgi:hypothetical protein
MNTMAIASYRTDLGLGPVRTNQHDCDHGFCNVCGAVWPCSRARREQLRREPAALVS